MVHGEGNLHHLGGNNGPIFDHRDIFDGTDCQDSGLWRIDDGGEIRNTDAIIAMFKNTGARAGAAK